jgi:trehalose 6-phosphate phosphatase
VTDEWPPLSLLEGAALFLDFDGTLVELAETPSAIQVSPALPPLLERLQQKLEGRLAIISGRSVGDLDRHLDCSGFAVSGSHGFELRLAGGIDLPLSVPAGLGRIKEEVRAFAKDDPRLIVETKPAGAALHYRKAPEREAEAAAFMGGLADTSGGSFTLQLGKMVVELKAAKADKGRAIRALMAEPVFADARPVFVGDDVTDEDGFAAAVAMGGAGVLVGAARGSAAQWRLDDVESVASWLSQAAEAL